MTGIFFLILVTFFFFFLINSFKRTIPHEINKIKKLVSKKKIQEAHNHLNKLPRNLKKRKEIKLIYYELYKIENQFFLAIYELEKILNSQEKLSVEEEIDYRLKKTELLNFLSKPKEAYQEYEKIIEMDGNNIEANFSIAKYLFGLNYYKTAKPYIKKTLLLEPDNTSCLEMMVNVLIGEKEYLEAKKIVEKITSIYQTKKKLVTCQIMHKSALISYFLENHQEALTIIERIDKSYQKNEELNLLKGLLFYKTNQNQECKEIFSQFLFKYIDSYNFIYLQSRYVFSELLFYDNEIKKAIEQINYIEKYKDSFLDNHQRKKIFNKLKSLDLLNLFFQGNSNQLIKKTLALGIAKKFKETITFKSYCFLHVFLNSKNTYEIHFFHYDIKTLDLSNWTNKITLIKSSYELSKCNLKIYSFYELDKKINLTFNLFKNAKSIIGYDFILKLK